MVAPRSRLILACALACAAGATGCRTVPPGPGGAASHGSVGMEMVAPPPGASRMELPQTQRFVFPRPLEPVRMPAYPPQLLARALDPVQVCVEIDIGAEGEVMAAHASPDPHCGNQRAGAAFLYATVDAVRRWRFEPALLCIAPDASADDPCNHPQVREMPTPVRLSYAFRFSQRQGAPIVERSAGR